MPIDGLYLRQLMSIITNYLTALANERLSKEFTCRAKGMVKGVHQSSNLCSCG